MKLSHEFCRLPLRFDAERLRAEIAALPDSAWHAHPTGYAGNSSVRLISIDGGENDDVSGEMRPTQHLAALPYVRQILAGFGVVWSRSRLMRLAPDAQVPEHCDINHHWWYRVRLHIPVITWPETRFYCGASSVHMGAGEAWIFDNWRPHRVENRAAHDRIHLVADTSGSAGFWQLAGNGQVDRFDAPQPSTTLVEFDSKADAWPMTERYNVSTIMHPAELEGLLRDFVTDLAIDTPDGVVQLAHFRRLIDGFCRDWRQLWSLCGETSEGWERFAGLRDWLRMQARTLGSSVTMRSNGVASLHVLDSRVLSQALHLPKAPPPSAELEYTVRPVRRPALIERPVFIVVAPRSGSTLLFETLACTPQLWTVGGEAHWLVEGFTHLIPGAPGIDSNRLHAEHAEPSLAKEMLTRITDRLRDNTGRPWEGNHERAIRFLEKTPKNALRIPFFAKLFPDALFVFLWREPQESISSIMEAWKSGNWITYPQLRDWGGPWSMLLPPGWRALKGRPLAEVAAFQWSSTNSIVMDDLAALDARRRLVIRYDQLLSDSATAVESICKFADIDFDTALRSRVANALPHARYTQTAPRADKWRENAADIEPLLPHMEATLQRLKAFG